MKNLVDSYLCKYVDDNEYALDDFRIHESSIDRLGAKCLVVVENTGGTMLLGTWN